MYLPPDPELQKLHEKINRRLKDLERKYPKAQTDSFQKSCMTWELLYGGKAIWLIDCPNRDIQTTMDKFNETFSVLSGFKAGLSTSAVSNKPDDQAIGFQILCYESARDTVRTKLKSLGIEDSEMHWLPENELRRQFNDWKRQQRKAMKQKELYLKKRAITNQISSESSNSGKRDLFRLIVDESRAHPDFIELRDSIGHEGARNLMNEIYSRMGDPTGNFIQDFQTNSYYSRLFELACFAYLESHSINIDMSFAKPDFLVSTKNQKVAVEAVTANPSSGLASKISLLDLEIESPEEIYEKSTNEFPIRMGTTLLKKLHQAYWAEPHCQNIPLVFIIGPFHEPGSTFYIDESLGRYLYGGYDMFADWVYYKGLYSRVIPIYSHEYEGRTLISNFFSQPSSEHVSAVIYGNSFTVSKFVRMAIQMGLETTIKATREGFCQLPGDNGDIAIQEYQYRVGELASPVETWCQGVTIFHNPNALIPLPDNYFKCTKVCRILSGKLNRRVTDFHPLTSFTVMNPIPIDLDQS
jgi:hypothetical protein